MFLHYDKLVTTTTTMMEMEMWHKRCARQRIGYNAIT